MVNFSIIGRNANKTGREEYYKWDKSTQERETFSLILEGCFPQLDISIGGKISIDICPKGWDKGQVVPLILARHPLCGISFFGDKLAKGGNDYCVLKNIEKYYKTKSGIYSVKSPEDTLNAIKSIMSWS
jgi:phosphomannomutase